MWEPAHGQDELAARVIGARLMALRLEQSLTQAQFADALGISARSYHHYERGTRVVPSDVLLRLHDAYGIMPNWVLLGVGQPKATEEGEEFFNFISELGKILAEDNATPLAAGTALERWASRFQRRFALGADMDQILSSRQVV